MGYGGLDPVALGLLKDMKHPGGNVTGIANWGPGIWGKRLELLRQWLPRILRVAAIYNPDEPNALDAFTAVRDYANRLGIQIEPLAARNPAEIRAAMALLGNNRPDALLILYDAANLVSRELICKEAIRMRLPTMADVSQYTSFGCLAAYGTAAFEAAREGARILSDILHGASPADIPMRQPTRSEFIINARTAAEIGLDIPPSVRLLADRVIE